MSDRAPTPQGSQAALDEAARRPGRLHRPDDRYRLVLLLLAAIYVAVGLIVAVPGPSLGPTSVQPAINLRPGIPILLASGLVAGVVLLTRMPASSRWGRGRFTWSLAAFSIWNAAVTSVSISTGWWGPGQPAVHFTLSAVVAAVPLVVGAWIIGSRRG